MPRIERTHFPTYVRVVGTITKNVRNSKLWTLRKYQQIWHIDLDLSDNWETLYGIQIVTFLWKITMFTYLNCTIVL